MSDTWATEKNYAVMVNINRPFSPIIYVRGYAMTQSEIDATSATPYMGLNLGATEVRQDWEGLAAAVTVYLFWPPGPKSIPGVTTELHWDLGRIGDLSYAGAPIKSEIQARFVTDAGQQTVDAKRNVIKSETRNHDDD